MRQDEEVSSSSLGNVKSSTYRGFGVEKIGEGFGFHIEYVWRSPQVFYH